MYLATVDWATSKPSLSSSPWMRGAPQSGFARLISPSNSAGTLGLPTRLRDRQRQKGPKANTMPANDRFRPDDRNGACGRGEPAIEPNKQKSIDICQSWPLWHPPAKPNDLLP